METWRSVWRDGVAPNLSLNGLKALQRALLSDDERLIQGATTSPPPLMCVSDWDVEGACPIGFAAWQGDGLTTVGAVEESFAKVCFNVDQALGEPAACRWFLNAWDEMPRQEISLELLAEVSREIAGRVCEQWPAAVA